ncbi:protein PFC0760c-like [Chironomus tepperi]|uniref:protein PFC0760c-like n=1 Tax=Chironomus tepperi TaxID=113505 RepID=UPI00391F3350
MNSDQNSSGTKDTATKTETTINFIDFVSKEVQKSCLINYTKDRKSKLTNHEKKCCKIIELSTDFNYDEILGIIGNLDRNEFPNLFVFIINISEISDIKELKEVIINFDKSRPLLLEIVSKNENIAKFYYKMETSEAFESIDRTKRNSKILNFSTFINEILNGHLDYCLNHIIENFNQLKNLQLILKILRLMKVDDADFTSLILKCAEYGSKTDLQALLDVPFRDDGNILNIEAQKYLNLTFDINLESAEAESDQVDGATFSGSSINDPTQNKVLDRSILSVAINNMNQEIIDYLIIDCTCYIQKLSFDYKVQVSNMAFNSKQLDLFSDLVEICDFPFPDNFTNVKFEHERLQKIVETRIKLQNAVKEDVNSDIRDIIENVNYNCSYFFNLENKSALSVALEYRNYRAYYYLVSKGFLSLEFDDIDQVLDAEELKIAEKFIFDQIITNVDVSKTVNSITKLNTKSRIHNCKIEGNQENEYRKRINKWFEDINKMKFGSWLLDIAASCDSLTIVFDFKSETIEKMSLKQRDALGATFMTNKWIFIGAKLFDDISGESREQNIKGVLAHELCHYVLRLVFENNENPYFEHKHEIVEKFTSIVKSIDKWSTSDEHEDDECNEIISNVFNLYEIEEFHQELIVRVVHILAHFDDDDDKVKHLENKYNILFEFFENSVIPEFKKFDMKKRQTVRKFNNCSKLFGNISNIKLKISIEPDTTKRIVNSKLVVVTTNSPKLLLINIKNYLYNEFGILINTEYIFVDIKFINESENLKNLFKILMQYSNLKVIVNCSIAVKNEVLDVAKDRFIFIFSDKRLKEELIDLLRKRNVIFSNEELNFNWNDLTHSDQKLFLQSKLNFQNRKDFTIFDILENCSKRIEDEQKEKEVFEYFSKIVNCHLMNFLLDSSRIKINVNLEQNDVKDEDEYFDFLFQPRQLIKKMGWAETKVSPDESFEKEKFIIVSDIAGSGKSWIMRKIAKDLKQKYPKFWISYIDLKQYSNNFKSQKNYNFPKFIAEFVLKFENSLEENIFYKLYAAGKVIIFFDGFDEVDSKHGLILNLIESFDIHNAGNQIWISTRDLYEDKIRERIKLKLILKLNEFSQIEGIDLIAKNWILEDIKNEKLNNLEEIENFVKDSSKYQEYKQNGSQISKKISKTGSRSIGLPRLFKMAADGFKNNTNCVNDLKEFELCGKIFKNFFAKYLEKKVSLESFNDLINFDYKCFHHFVAINTSFPEV